MRIIKKIMCWLVPVRGLPPPHPSCQRFTEIADRQARYAARIGRQA